MNMYIYMYNFAQILYAVVKTHNLILICPLYFFTNCFVLAVSNSIWHSLCGSVIFVADVSSISVSYILLNTFWINTPIVNESCVHFWNVTCRCTQFPIPNISYNNPFVDYFHSTVANILFELLCANLNMFFLISIMRLCLASFLLMFVSIYFLLMNIVPFANCYLLPTQFYIQYYI